MKYVIPRNRQIPDPSFADVLRSGALARDKTGNPEGDNVFAYRGSNPKLPKSDFISLGKIFPFTFGLIFIPDQAQGFGDYLAETISATTTLLVGTLPKMAIDSQIQPLSAGDHSALFAAHELATRPLNETIAKLVKLGALYLPGVEAVELEHQVDPGGFLRKGSHHSVLTYERIDGTRTTYSFATFSATAERLVNATIECVLQSRAMGEFDYLAGAVKSEQVDADQTWAAHVETYKKRYGDEWIKHIEELSGDVKKVLDAELEQKGFTTERAMAAILERIGPLVPSYRQAPKLSDWVKGLEEAAGGQSGAVAG
ncbi:MAG: hypothetical protein JWM21_3430 [Acidobacteria bacterium]|nr:hypothetical protein [Acidobacteriota bacterium]